MRILFLASRTPFPPDRGDRLRAYHVIRTLAEDHEIDVAAFSERALDEAGRAELLRHCRRVEVIPLGRARSMAYAARGLLSSEPLQVWYYRHPPMSRLVAEMTRTTRYDVVYSHLFRIFPFALEVAETHRVLDFTDVISSEILGSIAHRSALARPLFRLEGRRIRRFEAKAAAAADECWVVSDAERDTLASLAPSADVHVVPNGIDAELLEDGAPSVRRDGRIAFLGHLEVFHNVDGLRFFCEHVLPALRERPGEKPHLAVAGRGESREVDRLASHDGVEPQGYVESLREFLASAQLFVAPLRVAAGTQNKVLQAMAVGTPAVVSPQVLRGLGAGAEGCVQVADSPDEWVDRVGELLRDPERRERLGRAGREFVRARFTWDGVRGRMNAIADRLGARPSPGDPGAGA